MTLTSPHDAEEQLRPALGALFDATDQRLGYTARDEQPPVDVLMGEIRALNTALDQALALLGTRR